MRSAAKVYYPFNEFYFKIGFKNNSVGSNWNIGSDVHDVHDVQISDNFKLELSGSKIYFSGELILKCSVKYNCLNDLLSNINSVFIDECCIKKLTVDPIMTIKHFDLHIQGIGVKTKRL